jgi:hypothetical protein
MTFGELSAQHHLPAGVEAGRLWTPINNYKLLLIFSD